MENTAPIDVHYDEGLGIEWKVHSCPKTLFSTFRLIFPDLASILPKRSDPAYNDPNTQFYIVTVWQPTAHDMSGFSDDVQNERDSKTAKVRPLACFDLTTTPCFVDLSSLSLVH